VKKKELRTYSIRVVGEIHATEEDTYEIEAESVNKAVYEAINKFTAEYDVDERTIEMEVR